ncbi:hypothetical protein OXX69_003750 [Metschnikowia pulcherrima]
MKLVLIAVLAALGETMVINGVGSGPESGTINKRYAPSNDIDWDQEAGTRMIMQNVDVSKPEADDTRMFMENVKVVRPNLDFDAKKWSNNGNGKGTKKLPGKTGGSGFERGRETPVPETVEDWLTILRHVESKLPNLIKNMDLGQFWTMQNNFKDGVAEIKAIEGENGASAYYLQKLGQVYGRANQIAKEMCTKNPSVDSFCASRYPKKN